MTAHQDILGPGYTARTLELRGGNVATLVHHPALDAPRGAILYVHGFVDYFFQTHLADFFVQRGYAFYAVDLRRNGRSIRDGDLPWYTDDLNEYMEELDLALQAIRHDGHRHVIAMGHSTGGLTLPMWAQRRGADLGLDGIILNSPWLDLHKPWIVRTAGTWLVRGLARVTPKTPIPQGLSGVYPQTIHKAAHGEWDFNTDWKPLRSLPVRVGFLGAVRRVQANLHRGWDVRVPVLMMHSDRSLLGMKTWAPGAMTADTVLDVSQMDQWAAKIGPDVTTGVIPGGLHDLFLSPQPIRDHAFATLGAWLDGRVG